MKIWLSNSLIQRYILDNKQSSYHILPVIPVIKKKASKPGVRPVLLTFFPSRSSPQRLLELWAESTFNEHTNWVLRSVITRLMSQSAFPLEL